MFSHVCPFSCTDGSLLLGEPEQNDNKRCATTYYQQQMFLIRILLLAYFPYFEKIKGL
jgi:hypothetical protein